MIKKLGWDDVLVRLEATCIDHPQNVVYGVPKNGMLLCAFLRKAQVTHLPENATHILDDLIDSGATTKRYAQYPGQFVALYNKKSEGLEGTWLTFPWETETGPEDAVTRLLTFIGEDTKRDGLLDTPKRVVKAWQDATTGYAQDSAKILATTFTSNYNEMVWLRGIQFSSFCEHHLYPFTGEATVAYIPSKRVVGISKLARLVDMYAKRLQIQERMTNEIADAMEKHLQPKGAGVLISAHHSCMGCRGVLQRDAVMVTSCLRGVFLQKPEARAEFFAGAHKSA